MQKKAQSGNRTPTNPVALLDSDEELSSLWKRISEFSLDEESAQFPFTARLARDNNWTTEYSVRVVEEYKRFLFLAVSAGHPVTPSDQVDQAWHLHLLYTESYWEELCGRVLRQPLHHGPTRGGGAESDKFQEWYQRTLESYRRMFEKDPPSDIWPPANVRFGKDLYYRRVNTKRNWVIPRIGWGAFRGRTCLTFVAVALAVSSVWYFLFSSSAPLIGLAPKGSAKVGGFDIKEFLANYGDSTVVLAIVLVLVLIVVLYVLFGGRCPRCRRTHAISKTGRTEAEGKFFKSAHSEWKCKFCGHTYWKKDNSGGCGGCGGCG